MAGSGFNMAEKVAATGDMFFKSKDDLDIICTEDATIGVYMNGHLIIGNQPLDIPGLLKSLGYNVAQSEVDDWDATDNPLPSTLKELATRVTRYHKL